MHNNSLFLNVKQLAELMNISRSSAYHFLHQDDSKIPFKVFRYESRILIPKNDFFRWYNSLCQNDDKNT